MEDDSSGTRIISWNMRRASSESEAWTLLEELRPDLALLQEVTAVPDRVSEKFDCRQERATGKSGSLQRFSTCLLVRGELREGVPLASRLPWVSAELERHAGNILSSRVVLESGMTLTAISVYSPAWPIDRKRLEGIDTSTVKLTQNPDVWLADLLWHCLSLRDLEGEGGWVVGGDFNLSETFDSWNKKPRGNLEYLNRMVDLGLTECLREHNGGLVPTFRNPGDGKVKHQMDHLFVTGNLRSRLRSCLVGPATVFDAGLSDHLPIVATFS